MTLGRGGSLAGGFLLATMACSDPTAPELGGSWGGSEAILEFRGLGGRVVFACSGGEFGPGCAGQ